MYTEKVNEKGFVYWEHNETGEIAWENPLYQPPETNVATYEETDWVMYYDEEGNPYWYNEVTGESEWADLNAGYEEHVESAETSSNAEDEEGDDDDDDDDDSDDSESDSDEDSDSDSDDSEDSSDDSDQEFEEDDLEAKFQAMLETPEGRAALEAEKQAILEEEAKKEARERRFNLELQNSNIQRNKPPRQTDGSHHIIIDANEDIEAGAWSKGQQLLNNRRKGEKSKVRFDMDEPEPAPPGRLETAKAKWLVVKGTCRDVTRRTKRWVTKILQNALLGAFSFAKYSLEYAERLTADDDEHDESDVEIEMDIERRAQGAPKPPRGPPPSKTSSKAASPHPPPPPPRTNHGTEGLALPTPPGITSVLPTPPAKDFPVTVSSIREVSQHED